MKCTISFEILALFHVADKLSSKWACPIHSTNCRVNGPRLANGAEHIEQETKIFQTLSACTVPVMLLRTNSFRNSFFFSDSPR